MFRKVGKNLIHVISEVNGIDSEDYDIKYNDAQGSKHSVINKVWLKLLGINDEPYVITNKEGARKHLTILRLLRSFYLNETDIDEPNSILLPSKPASDTPYFLSSLLYLFTGNDFSEQDLHDSDKISAVKRKAMEDFAHERISIWSKQRDQLESTVKAGERIAVEAELEKSIDQLANAEKSLTDATAKLGEILTGLTESEEKAAESSLILSRYKALKTQYTADIKRLTFIAEGEEITKNLPQKSKCPYCDGTIPPRKRVSFTESAKNELARIIIQLQGLEKSKENVWAELNDIKQRISYLETQRSYIQAKITETLNPLTRDLKEKIHQYRIYIEITQKYSLINKFSKDLETALAEKTTDPVAVTEFKPREHFPKDFVRKMEDYADRIFEECQYRGFNKSGFNISKFDILVNGEFKQDSHGKGYYSFINTIVGLALRQYFINHAIYKPGLFIVDTPLHGFDEGVAENDKKSMKYNLFHYFIAHASEGQLIVIENKRNLPKIDFDSLGVNVIDFTHNNYVSEFKNSRYGFLNGIKK